MEFVNTILSIIIGWGLGLFSPFIVKKFQLKRKKAELLNGILTELKDVRVKLVSLSFLLGKDAGKFDREFLEWCIPVFRDYEGPEQAKDVLSSVEKLLEQSNDQIENIRKATAPPEGIGFSLKHYEIPFTQSKMSEITMLDINLQKIVLNVISHIDLLNAEIDVAMKYHFMTYDSSVSEENHKRLLLDIKQRVTIQVL